MLSIIKIESPAATQRLRLRGDLETSFIHP
jgi:hypothetical protein